MQANKAGRTAKVNSDFSASLVTPMTGQGGGITKLALHTLQPCHRALVQR